MGGAGVGVALADADGVVVVDGWEGAEKQAADVGQSGGAAGGDAVAGEQIVEFVQRIVDVLRALEAVLLPHERVEEVGVAVENLLFGEVVSAQTGLEVRGEQAALMSAGGKTVSAAGWCCFVAGGLVRHDVLRSFRE